jgi:hypothetical protein
MPKFFFGDGRSADTPEPDNVQVIVQYTEHDGWMALACGDYYVEVDGVWVKCDLQGALDWMKAKGYLLQGRTLPNEQFADIFREALAYRDKQ